MVRKLLIIALLGANACFAQDKKAYTPPPPPQFAHYKEIGDPLPPIMVFTTDGNRITEKDVKNDANLFVMLFNPTCSHCEEMTKQLERNIKLFNNSKLLLVCPHLTEPYLKDFTTRYHTKDYYPTMTVAVDSILHLVDKTYTYQSIPQISIYDKDRKLIKRFNGDIAIDSLKPYIQ
jgi:thioredoxin-related protein